MSSPKKLEKKLDEDLYEDFIYKVALKTGLLTRFLGYNMRGPIRALHEYANRDNFPNGLTLYKQDLDFFADMHLALEKLIEKMNRHHDLVPGCEEDYIDEMTIGEALIETYDFLSTLLPLEVKINKESTR